MTWPLAFRRFNPLEQRIADLDTTTQYVIDKALTFLQNRTIEELKSGLQVLYTIRCSYFLKSIVKSIERVGKHNDKSGMILDADTLRLAIEDFDISGQQDFPNAKWSEYFALNALAQIGEIVSSIYEHAKDRDPDELIKGNPLITGACLDALDSLCDAAAQHALETRIEKYRAAGKKGGKRRVERYHALRLRVLEIHDQMYTNRSAKQAATLIVRYTLNNEELAILVESNRELQIEKWIRAHRREIKAQS